MNGVRWVILRTSGGRTIPLARSLVKIGIEAWAPTMQLRKRRPRSTKFQEVTLAMMPTFVFAPEADLGRLLAIVHAPVSDHPPFTVFQHGTGFPTIRDAALQPLRHAEAKLQEAWEAAAKPSRRKSAARRYVMGQLVRVDKAAFAGLTGEITSIRKNGDLVLAVQGLPFDTIIPACDVLAIQVDSASSEQGKAA